MENIDPSSLGEELLNRLQTFSGVILLLGGVDRGKTTLAFRIVNFFLSQGKKVAWVDADLGQSTVGPPTTVGLGFPSNFSLEERLFTPYFHFVGDISPRNRITSTAVFTHNLVERAHARTEVVLVDTCGFFQGEAALYLKTLQLRLTQPELVIGIGKKEEFSVFKKMGVSQLLELPPAAEISPKKAIERRSYREHLFSVYFSRAQNLVLDLANFRLFLPLYPSFYCQKTFFSQGAVKFCWEDKVWVLTERVDFTVRGRRFFKASPSELYRVLGCLYNEKGEEIGLGVIQEVNLEEKKLTVWGVKAQAQNPVFFVPGRVKLDFTGREVGRFGWHGSAV